jgi:hypothetical protein
MSRLRAMVEVVTAEGSRVFINPAHVRSIVVAEGGARLEFGGDQATVVRQRSEEVAAVVDRWLAAYLGPG